MTEKGFESRNLSSGYEVNGDRVAEEGFVEMPNVLIYANIIFGPGTVDYKDWLVYAGLKYIGRQNSKVREAQDEVARTVGLGLGLCNRRLKKLCEKKFLVAENHGVGRPKAYNFNCRVAKDSGTQFHVGELREQIEQSDFVKVSGGDDYRLIGNNQWPNFIITKRRKEMGFVERGILLALEAHRMSSKKVFPSQERLALMLGCSESAIVKGVLKLRENKWLDVEQRGKMQTNCYVININKAEATGKGDKKVDALVSKDGFFVPVASLPSLVNRDKIGLEVRWRGRTRLMVFKVVDWAERGEHTYPVEMSEDGLTLSIDSLRLATRLDVNSIKGFHKIGAEQEYETLSGLWFSVTLARTEAAEKEQENSAL